MTNVCDWKTSICLFGEEKHHLKDHPPANWEHFFKCNIQSRNFEYCTIWSSSINSYIDVSEAVICIYHCKQNDTVKSLVIVKCGCTVWRANDGNMLSIKSPTAIEKVPLCSKWFLDRSPLFYSIRNLYIFAKLLIKIFLVIIV